MNTNLYCLVNIPTANVVLQGPQLLPQNWQAADGTWYYNLNNDSVWSDPALLIIGWYPYIESDIGAPGPYYDRALSDFVINPTTVSRNAIYTQWDIERVKQQKDDEMAGQLTEYSTNELALNSKVSDYVNNDAKWYTTRQADLARIDDWQAAADFDTAKPDPLVLPNSYVGRSYVNQGLVMQAENDAAVKQSLSPRWDQPTLDSFVAVNQLAAEDSSDSTPPLEPTFKLRQGIAVPSERFSRTIIYRFDVEGEVDPNLDRSMGMIMTNKQDSRPLYVFIYGVNFLTYLGWKEFKLQPNGTWKWFLDKDAGDGSIMVHTDTDVSFIFSYGTNPSYEPDYFTDRVNFPSGVETQQLIVSWDAGAQA